MFCESLTPEAIEQLPTAVFQGEIVEVRTAREAERAVSQMAEETLLGFDTETRPCFTTHPGGRHKTALLQLASANQAFLFRLPFCGVTAGLASLLSNPQIKKVGVAVRDDIRGLYAYRLFSPAGFVDLQSITESCGIKEKSLRKLAAITLNLKLSKGQQLSNWENRDFTPAQRHYAALDAWICREIYLTLQK